MITGTVKRSPGICLRAEENPGKLQIGIKEGKKGWGIHDTVFIVFNAKPIYLQVFNNTSAADVLK